MSASLNLPKSHIGEAATLLSCGFRFRGEGAGHLMICGADAKVIRRAFDILVSVDACIHQAEVPLMDARLLQPIVVMSAAAMRRAGAAAEKLLAKAVGEEEVS